MPNKDKKKPNLFKINKRINTNLDLLDNSLNDLYANTYFTQKNDEIAAKSIRSDIDDHINNIMDNTYTNSNIGNMTKLYTKLALKRANGDKDLIDAMQIFNDQEMSSNILSTWMQNKWIKDLDNEIDMVLKYMPKLREALACKKDCILSADHFSKDFISYHNISTKGKEEIFAKRMEEIKKVYKLPKNYEKWYDQAQTYGECFVYVAPYSREFEKLLNTKQSTQFNVVGESFSIVENGTVNMEASLDRASLDKLSSAIAETNISNLTMTLNTSGMLTSAAEDITKIRNITDNNKIVSMKEMFMENALNEAREDKIEPNLIPDDLKFPTKIDDEITPGEMIIGGRAGVASTEKITVPGAIVKTLERSNVIPVYIDDVCLGYYYLEFKSNGITFDDPNSMEYVTALNTMGASGRLAKTSDAINNANRDSAINFIAQQLSDVIDSKFINNNQDLRSELYTILKHCDLFNSPANSVEGNINITFLSAEDVTHMYFKQDPITKRGISDLAYSLFPAKLYSSLYITSVLGQITRGQDKRVYYVKQNVETNISKTLLNVLNQIKKGNMGARQMENLGNVLNVSGRFNDLIIPLSPGGDAPVQFEIMQGQQFTDNSELMNALEKMAIDPTGIPYDLVEARQSLDYAIQATMSNSKLMRATYNRQDLVQDFFSDISSKIYNYEYDENERIDIMLPAPSFLNMTNGAQLINGTIDYINTITAQELSDEDEAVQNEFKKISTRYYLPTHINLNVIDKHKEQARMNVAKNRSATQEEEQ